VLTIVQILRKKGVVGKFVEFFGAGLSALSLADRATVANMAPEYGATMGFFPWTRRRLRTSSSPTATPICALVEAYTKEQGLFRTDATADPVYSDTLELDLASVAPSMAGPKRPQDRVELPDVRKIPRGVSQPAGARGRHGGQRRGSHRAITSCTNTSNPSVMLAAGLLAKKAVERG